MFFFFGNRGRFALVGFTLLSFLSFGHVDRFPIAAAEVRAVGHLKRLSEASDAYRREHPAEGFPAALQTVSTGDDTESTEQLYKVTYTVSRSNLAGPADRFVIQANPLWRDCGYIRGFAVTNDGKIHSTLEDRPANDSDPVIESREP